MTADTGFTNSSTQGFEHHLFVVGDSLAGCDLGKPFVVTQVPLHSPRADDQVGSDAEASRADGKWEHVVAAISSVAAQAHARGAHPVATVIVTCSISEEHRGGPSTSSPQIRSGAGNPQRVYSLLQSLRAEDPAAFLVLWHPGATEDARLRVDAFAAGANMVTHSPSALKVALERVASQAGTGSISCDWCGMQHLTPEDYWMHQPLYHIYDKQRMHIGCQVCGEAGVPNLAVHLHDMHGPQGPHPEVRTNAGSAVIVHRVRDNRFLVVQEFAGQGYWLPGGGNDPGEPLVPNALRECLEEAGVEVELQGLLEVKWDLQQSPPWRLAMMYAVPKQEGAEPKTLPDFESAGACWVSAEELDALPIRNPVCMEWIPKCAAGGFQLHPLEIPEHAREIFKGLEMS